jgi:hypothetical protein
VGLLEPHGRRRGRDGQARLKTVTIGNLAEARAALNAGRAAGERVRLRSETDAVLRYGVLYFVQMTERLAAEYPELRPDVAVDCGDRADLALAAMRSGLRNIVFHGDPRFAEKLAGIAAELRIRFESHPVPSGPD